MNSMPVIPIAEDRKEVFDALNVVNSILFENTPTLDTVNQGVEVAARTSDDRDWLDRAIQEANLVISYGSEISSMPRELVGPTEVRREQALREPVRVLLVAIHKALDARETTPSVLSIVAAALMGRHK